METQKTAGPGNRKLKARRDPRLSGIKRSTNLQLDEVPYERLMTHCLKKKLRPNEVVNALILDGLPCWTIQERGGGAEGKPGSDPASPGESAVEALPVAQTLKTPPLPPDRGRGGGEPGKAPSPAAARKGA